MRRSFRWQLSVRLAATALVLFALVGAASVVALRAILLRQLDTTILHLAEVEANAGAAVTGDAFEFHEGVLLSARPSPTAELTRYAELWTAGGSPVARSRNLGARDLPLPAPELARARSGALVWMSHAWRGEAIRCVLYPLRLLAPAHAEHVLQIAAPLAPLRRTVSQFVALLSLIGVAAVVAGFGGAWFLAGVAVRPAQQIAAQAEAIEAGTLSARITAHAEVTEYRRLVAVLNAMLGRLDRAFDAQRRFTANASHELRAPLTVLKGNIDVALRRERAPEEYRRVLESNSEEVDRIARLAEDLLVLARAEAGARPERPVLVDLRAIADRVRAHLAPRAEAGDLRLELEPGSAPAHGDPLLLERAVANLVENAIKFTPSGGRIAVRLAEGNGVASVEVEDTGPGIRADDAPHIFDRFYRGDAAASAGGGAGLGLPIARAIAEAHGGSLVLVRAGPGALFRLSIPAALTPGC